MQLTDFQFVRRSLVVVALSALGFIPVSLVFAGTIKATKTTEANDSFSYSFIHDAITANVAHNPTSSNLWENKPTITEGNVNGQNNGDTFALTGTIQHLVKSHGAETEPNPNVVPMNPPAIEVGQGGFTNNKYKTIGLGTVKHRDPGANIDHFDGGIVTVGFQEANGKDATSYDFTIKTMHLQQLPPKGGGGGMEKRSGMTAVPEAGSATWIADASSGRFSLTVYVDGVALTDVSAATIRLDTPSSPGSVIYDLVPSQFETIATTGIIRVVDGIFPAAHRSSLYDGKTFVEIVTPSFTHTAQLSAAAIDVPSTSKVSLVLLVLALGALGAMTVFFAGRRRLSTT